MMLSRTLFITLTCCLLISGVFAQDRPPDPPRPISSEVLKSRASAIDIYGELAGHEYRNKFFGFTFVLPEHFSILNRTELELYSKAGAEIVGGDESSRSQRFEQGVKDTIVLFAATYTPEEPAKLAAVEIVAVKQPDNATANLALAASVRLMTETGKYTVTESLNPKMIGGREFVGVEYETTAFGISMRQRTYATMRNGYSLFVSFVYLSPEGLATLENAVEGFQFN
ncbi:MAG TPA: hypothetical protein PKD24_04710 [Pyrinomonadaceae bacterium]|nr:hypothetical protein [Pyrinomonadaceae bacterium]HMP64854.1 hypothetical protein [Pyrinomonadaceae bacterium]